MTSVNQNVTIYQKTTPTLQFTITDDDGNAKDLSNATITWEMSVRPSSSAIVSKTQADMTVSGVGNNVVSFTLTTADTDQNRGQYYHELRANDGTLDAVCASGDFVVRASSTKS